VYFFQNFNHYIEILAFTHCILNHGTPSLWMLDPPLLIRLHFRPYLPNIPVFIFYTTHIVLSRKKKLHFRPLPNIPVNIFHTIHIVLSRKKNINRNRGLRRPPMTAYYIKFDK
jgi:hypothetical protein